MYVGCGGFLRTLKFFLTFEKFPKIKKKCLNVNSKKSQWYSTLKYHQLTLLAPSRLFLENVSDVPYMYIIFNAFLAL
jgi:hypothetical protein